MALPDVNLDEYVSETIQMFKASGRKPTQKDVAATIVNTFYDQGYYTGNPTDADLLRQVAEVMDQLPYYAPELK